MATKDRMLGSDVACLSEAEVYCLHYGRIASPSAHIFTSAGIPGV